MSDRLMALAEQLAEADLTGQGAFRYGSPDRVMLISGGPASHLARWSMMAGPPSFRVSIRQPTRDMLSKAAQHSPLNDGIQLAPMPDVLIAEVEQGVGGEGQDELCALKRREDGAHREGIRARREQQRLLMGGCLDGQERVRERGDEDNVALRLRLGREKL